MSVKMPELNLVTVILLHKLHVQLDSQYTIESVCNGNAKSLNLDHAWH